MRYLAFSFIIMLYHLTFDNIASPLLRTNVTSYIPSDDYEGYNELEDFFVINIFSSSSLNSENINTYDANNLNDGNLKTAWIEGEKDYGIDETFSYIREIRVGSISFFNGYAKSNILWQLNFRVKLLSLSKNGIELFQIELNDTINHQYVDLRDISCQLAIKNNDTLQFKILEVYPGIKYLYTAISEIEFERF